MDNGDLKALRRSAEGVEPLSGLLSGSRGLSTQLSCLDRCVSGGPIAADVYTSDFGL